MSEKGNGGPKAPPVFERRGYTPAPVKGGMAQDGFRPATGQLGTPPTQGSAVSKPAQSKKD